LGEVLAALAYPQMSGAPRGTTMKVRGKLSADEVKDVGNLVRSTWYWPKLLLRSSYGIVLFAALIWGTFNKLVSGSLKRWDPLVIAWVVVAALVGYAVVSTRREQRKELQELNSGLPDVFSLDQDGIRTERSSGGYSFQPWSNFAGWRKGRAVVLLDLATTKGFMMIPFRDLSEATQVQLEQLLITNLRAPRSS
jgi:hypothetical protein